MNRKKPAPGKRKPVAARERILSAAGGLFYTRGYQAAGIDRIVSEAGVYKKSLYWHFKSKEDLGEAYLKIQEKAITEILQKIMTRHPEFSRMVRSWIRVIRISLKKDYQNGCPFANFHSQTHGVKKFEKQTLGIFQRWRKILEDYIAVCRFQNPYFQPDPADFADHVLMLYQGSLQMYSLTGEEKFIAILEKELLELEFQKGAKSETTRIR